MIPKLTTAQIAVDQSKQRKDTCAWNAEEKIYALAVSNVLGIDSSVANV